MQQATRQAPPFERRSHKRILTFRNVRNALLLLLFVLVVLNIRSEMRDTTGGEYGRLYGRGIDSATAVAPAEPAEPAPVAEAPGADPFSLDAARREQYLGAPQLEPVPLLEPQSEWPAPRSPAAGTPVQVVGGPDGVSVVTAEPRKGPVLGGGFGRE